MEAVGTESGASDADRQTAAFFITPAAGLSGHAHLQFIHLRILRTPQCRRAQGQFTAYEGAILHLCNLRGASERPAIFLKADLHIANRALRHEARRAAQGGLHLQYGLLRRHGRSGHVDAPVGDSGLGHFPEVHIAVESAARIPARRFFRVIQLHGYLVGAFVKERRHIDEVGNITVRSAAGLNAANQHFRPGHCAPYLQPQATFQVFCAYLQALAILSPTPPAELSGLAGILLHEFSLHAPIVRKVHAPRLRAVKGKTPAIAQQLLFRLFRAAATK